MLVFLTKSDASEGFDLAIVLTKKSNDVVKLQALIDRKKVIITEDTIRQNLRLDDADGVDYLPNKEIFAELARMGYEKPSTKLIFYKEFLSAQWKFLIQTIVRCMSAKRTAWNEFSSSMASIVICLATDNLSSHNSKFTSPALTQKVFANMWRIGKGFSGVETHLFDNILVQQQVHDDAEVEEDEVPQQQPSQTPNILESSMTLLNTLMETCATLTQKVSHLEQDKVAQALKITKLKQRGRMEEDVTAVKDINVAKSKPTVFDDEEEIKQAAARERQEKEDLEIFKVLQQQYDQKQEDIDWNIVVRPIFEREYKHVQTFLKLDRDEEPTKKRPAKGTLLQESLKKLRVEVEVSEKDYPLSNQVMTLMLSTRLQIEEDSEAARDLVMKTFFKANQPKSKSLDISSN
nr:hypothetical protein [Tanacetum cinerariifolium]